MLRGTIVKSKAGRDKDGFLVVIDFSPPYAYLCDGKERPLENPKKKKIIHIARTKTVLEEEYLLTNKKIFRALRNFRENLTEVI